ncbi:MAG: hypothetical protein V7K67_34005 [Nostoc sp.]|uniref:hypothetical protein n=1 Tax=Nostoc sp. TaxID=1180 RepID=UPI002FF61B94
MYKKEEKSVIHPDGTVETIIKIEHNESGILEFCGAIAVITFFSLVVWLIINGSNHRRVDSPVSEPNQTVRNNSP